MDKTPDFALDASPPHFSYDFSDASPAPHFDPFAYSFDASPRLGPFSGLALAPQPPFFHPPHPFPAPSPTAHSFTSASSAAARPFTPQEGSDLATIAPPLTLAPAPAAPAPPPAYPSSEQDDSTPGRRSSTNSPPSSASAGPAPTYRAAARYTPLPRAPRPARKSARRGVRRDDDDLSDDDPDPVADEPMELGVSSSDIIQRRREEIRRQRIESEQRRRDELRDGYAKLKYALPISNQKSSKVSLLDRAVTYIRQLETSQASLQTRLDNAEGELTRLRNVNEQLMRNLADQHRAVTLSALAAANAQASASASQASSSSAGASAPPSPRAPKKPAAARGAARPKSPSF